MPTVFDTVTDILQTSTFLIFDNVQVLQLIQSPTKHSPTSPGFQAATATSTAATTTMATTTHATASIGQYSQDPYIGPN